MINKSSENFPWVGSQVCVCLRLCVCVWLCVCVFIILHITAESGSVILVILCHSH